MDETRREFLGWLLGGAIVVGGCARMNGPRTPTRMPVVFVGHGSPMNVIEDNAWSRGFASLSTLIPRPRAIVAVSAHWYVDGTWVTIDARPRTIHDFGGFPRELYEIQYPAPGHVDLSTRIRKLLGEERAGGSGEWGLDHGTWSVLRWMYPEADVPVVQLSIDRRLDPKRHFELARGLAELRHEGVLILGSGNVTHNLRDAFARMRAGDTTTPDWARRFDETVRDVSAARDWKRLLALWPDSDDGRKSHPTGDHFLPLIYTSAVVDDADEVRFPIQGFDGGSLSMRSVVYG